MEDPTDVALSRAPGPGAQGVCVSVRVGYVRSSWAQYFAKQIPSRRWSLHRATILTITAVLHSALLLEPHIDLGKAAHLE